MASDSILRQKCIEMMQYGYHALRDIPRDYRYTLGTDMRTCMTSMLQLIIRSEKKYYKKTTLEDLDIQLDILRALILVAVENRVISPREYRNWALLLDEMGRLIGGWIRAVKKGKK